MEIASVGDTRAREVSLDDSVCKDLHGWAGPCRFMVWVVAATASG